MEGSGCNLLAMVRGAGCRGEERMVNVLKVGRWKLENGKKGGRWSKGIESTRDEETRMRGACKMARAHNGVKWGAGASKGREMEFGEEDGVVGWARGSALGNHLHKGEQRWTLDGRPLKRVERQLVTKMEIIAKRKELYNETLRPILHSGHKQPLLETILISIVEQTGEPHPSPII